jgi:tetratricopeptide (TPR) repeat protein
VNRPRKSLNNITPADAAGSPRLRKKLLGVIAFLEQCASGGMVSEYKFDSLRGKLGLLSKAAAAPAAAQQQAVTAAPAEAGQQQQAADGIMSDEQLEQAYQAAHRQGDREAAAGYARALVGRPAPAAKPDRYPYYLFLIQKAMTEGALDDVLDFVNAGQSGDCEHNGGARRNDFELLRARVLARRGEKDKARDTFQSLIERAPRNFEARGQAAKAMLDLREPDSALKFAEEGVTAARQANNRDAEQMLLELSQAAKKALGK